MAVSLDDTTQAPRGGEIYQVVENWHGLRLTLTYNELWLQILRDQLAEGSWSRLLVLTNDARDYLHKRALVEHLWQLELEYGELPDVPEGVHMLHFQRAYVWFYQKDVSQHKRW